MAPTPSQLPGTLADSGHPQEGEYSGSYQPTQASQAPPQHYGQPGPYHSQPTYLPAPSVSYSQPAPQRNMAQAPYPYQQYTHPVAAPPVVQAAEPTHPTPSYVGSYNIQTQHLAGPYRSDPYYYSQSSGSPTAESPYGHQYMAFRQPHLTIAYPETVQTPSLASPSVLPLVSSPERPVGEQHIRGVDEVNYGSIATNYRHIITTVSQASPSPSTDSSNQSFEPPIVDDMLHRAVEGLRHLDPTRAEQYAYSGEFAPQMISSGVVAPESPAGTVFVQYYEDGKSEGNPTKKKVCPTLQSRVHQNLVHEEVINVRMRQKRDRKGATQCASCQATSTPEWRRGPLGPRTLCNACGLVYAKLMKKRAREEDNLSPGESPRRARSKGKARGVTEESEEDRITEQGSDDTLPPTAGPSVAPGLGYPP